MRQPLGLFITHDFSNYGAATSLEGLLRATKTEIRCDLLLASKYIRHETDKQELIKRFRNIPREASQLLLPYDYGILGDIYPQNPQNIKDKIKHLLSTYNTFYLRNIATRRYSFCHLNSLALHDLTSIHKATIIHVREVFQGKNYERVISNLNKAAGIIFIDKATREKFPDLLAEFVIINNPFDMTDVPEYSLEKQILLKYHLNNKVVFSMIGAVSESKGSKYVIEEFISADVADKAILLIVGSGNEDYIRSLRNTYAIPSIVFWGEEAQIKRIYRYADFIVRGDYYSCFSRSMFEGLYSGVHVILQGKKEDYNFDADVISSVHFYETRKPKALASVFKQLSSNKIADRSYRSNFDEYKKQYLSFLSNVLLTSSGAYR